ncbi:MAG: cupin domain-containing protein [Pseudomonadota bacterium]
MKNIFDAIPTDLKREAFEQLVESDCVTIERIVSKGHSSPASGWYDQHRNEWVMVLQGQAVLMFEDGPSKVLKRGDFINIAAHRKHRVEWTTPDVETIWLAVYY